MFNLFSRFMLYIVLEFLHRKITEHLVILFRNIHTQTAYYKKCISRLVANFLCNTTAKYHRQHGSADLLKGRRSKSMGNPDFQTPTDWKPLN